MLSLRIAGIWAQTFGDYGQIGDVEVEHIYSTTGGGLHTLKWSMALPKNYYHPALKAGSKVELFRGPVKLGSATLAEPDRTNWTFVADGFYRRAEKFRAEDASHVATNNLTTAITQANLRGLGWNGVGNLPTPTWGTVTADVDENNTIAALLNAYCTVNAMRWGLTLDDIPYIVADPVLNDPATVSRWAISPGVPLMPISDDVYSSRTVIRYATAYSGSTPTAFANVSSSAGDGSIEHPNGHEVGFNLSTWGVMSQATAQAYADDHQRRNGLRHSYTQGLDIHPGELTTPGGTTIDNWAACFLLGKMGLHYGTVNKTTGSAVGNTVQWVMGSTKFRPGDNSLTIASVDLEPRTVSSVARKLAGVAETRKAMDDAARIA